MKLFTERDDASINDASTIYSKKRRRGESGNMSAVAALKFTKQSLMPPKNKYHKIGALDSFLSSKYDRYIREYSDYFIKELQQFEEKLEEHRREFQLNILSEKRSGGNATANGVGVPQVKKLDSKATDSAKKTAEQLMKEEEEN